MTASERYLKSLVGLIEQINATQKEKIDKASDVLAQSVENGKLIYVWGPGGHSSIFAEDVLYRKSELAAVNPIIDPGISLSHGAAKSINSLERIEGLGRVIIRYNRIKKDDVIIFGSAYGINPVLIEAVIECKKIGAKVLAVTSLPFSKNATFSDAKHESKKLLYQLADIYIDSCVPSGDAVVEIEGLDFKTTPVATIMQLIALKALMAETIEKLVKRGTIPPIWTSSLVEGGIQANADYMDKIWGSVKSM
jgi:uncharacterized phosphosugar-binding protein